MRPRGQSGDLLMAGTGTGAAARCAGGEGSPTARPVLPTPVPTRLPRVPASSRAVPDSHPVERRFSCGNRVPGRDKSRGNLWQSQVAPAAREGAAGQSPPCCGAWGRGLTCPDRAVPLLPRAPSVAGARAGGVPTMVFCRVVLNDITCIGL